MIRIDSKPRPVTYMPSRGIFPNQPRKLDNQISDIKKRAYSKTKAEFENQNFIFQAMQRKGARHKAPEKISRSFLDRSKIETNTEVLKILLIIAEVPRTGIFEPKPTKNILSEELQPFQKGEDPIDSDKPQSSTTSTSACKNCDQKFEDK